MAYILSYMTLLISQKPKNFPNRHTYEAIRSP